MMFVAEGAYPLGSLDEGLRVLVRSKKKYLVGLLHFTRLKRRSCGSEGSRRTGASRPICFKKGPHAGETPRLTLLSHVFPLLPSRDVYRCLSRLSRVSSLRLVAFNVGRTPFGWLRRRRAQASETRLGASVIGCVGGGHVSPRRACKDGWWVLEASEKKSILLDSCSMRIINRWH